MGVTVKLFYPKAQQQMEGREEVEVAGETVGDCLAGLFRRYPGAERFVVDDKGKLLEPVWVYVHQENAAKAAMDAPVKDGDSIIVAFLVTGG